jgi:hypothetical protein
MQYLPNGIGATLGDSLATTEPLILTGNVWYVDSATGTDAVSPAGKNREKPLATLAQAHTNASANDIIVCLSGHSETLTAGQVFTKSVLLIGEGASGALPTVKFTQDAAAAGLFSIVAAGVEIRNIWFEEAAQLASVNKVYVDAVCTDFRLTDCYFEGNANDALALVAILGARCTIEGCTFISTATDTAAQPYAGIETSGAISDLRMIGVKLSDGTVGWSGAAMVASGAAVTRLRCEGLSLLLGAEMLIHASSTGHVNPATSTGGGRVSW